MFFIFGEGSFVGLEYRFCEGELRDLEFVDLWVDVGMLVGREEFVFWVCVIVGCG